MRPPLIAALLCTGSLLLPCAYAQQSGADTNQLTLLRALAEQGDAKSQFELGLAFSIGKYGAATNYVQAVHWYLKAAEQNFAQAQFDLGVCYANGWGMAKDEVEAYQWWLLAGAQRHEEARSSMTELERRLTRKQVADGQKRGFDLKLPEAPPFAIQQGQPEDNPLADLRAKAATGDAQAQNELGEALYAGKRGVARNPVEAAKWFRQAADQNLAAAQSNLGVCYERGDGVAKYEVEACKWYLLAAAQGDAKARRNADMLELMLSQEELADRKRRAKAWLEQRGTSSPGSKPTEGAQSAKP